MNKTLLLIICDFLLLNLLALTRWEDAEPPRPSAPAVESRASDGAATKDQDLLEVMKLSLEDERSQREQTLQQLQATQDTLKTREQNLSQLESEKTNLAATLDNTQRKATELTQKVEAATADASMSKERLAQLQRELEQREAEAARQKTELAKLAAEQAQARERIENLSVAVKVAEQEKVLLRETAETLKGQVEVERQERIKVQETTTQLAQGVGQLAEKSTELTKEIRDNRPINANTLYQEFLDNRVKTQIYAERPGLFGGKNRKEETTNTVFITDGTNTYALLHFNNTPFSFVEQTSDWDKLTVEFSKGSYRTQATALHFLSSDPRVIVLPVDAQQVAGLGVKPYQLALDRNKFPDALLISNGGAGYGEVAYKLDASQPGYVRMDNRLMKKLFGDFSPSRGDLVLSKTGELLGIMANSDYCVVVNNFLPSRTIKTGENITDQKTGKIFDHLVARWRALPLRLQ